LNIAYVYDKYGLHAQEIEMKLHGKVASDIAMWIPTPKLEMHELEEFGCRYRGIDAFDPACFLDGDIEGLVCEDGEDHDTTEHVPACLQKAIHSGM